jgi:hypothetical protein
LLRSIRQALVALLGQLRCWHVIVRMGAREAAGFMTSQSRDA